MKKRKLYILFNILSISSVFFISSCSDKKNINDCEEQIPTVDPVIVQNDLDLFIYDDNYIYQIIDKNNKELSIFKTKDTFKDTELNIKPFLKIGNQDYKITEIGFKAFENKNISKVNLSESNIKKIKEYSFKDNNIDSLLINESISEIADFAFYNNKIKEIKLTKNLKRVGKYSFANNNISKIEFANLNLGIDFINNDWSNINIQDIKELYENKFLYNLEDFSFSNNELEAIEIPDYIITMNCGVFSDNQIKSVNIRAYQSSYTLGTCNPFDSKTQIIKK